MLPGPFIINSFKPARMSSQDVVRLWKREIRNKKVKLGHFGTLDPFACGVLLVGVNGAQRLNELVHEFCPKTYLAVGKLGVETETGDLTVSPSQVDDSTYLKDTISKFDKEFIQERLSQKFLGEYYQAPHKYSAAKFEGKKLHEWARAGVDIQKEKKRRFIFELEVVKYAFPYLSIRFTVSSGTYIRSLFSDCANDLGTLGTLVSLVREKVGGATLSNSLYKKDWNLEQEFISPEVLLPFEKTIFDSFEAKLIRNGVHLKEDRCFDRITGSIESKYSWLYDRDQNLLGLSEFKDGSFYPRLNFS